MLEGIRFLFSFCWRTNKKYVLVLLAWKITEAILPLINIVIPKFIIDELIGAKSIQRLMYYTGALIFVNFVGTLLSRFLTSQSLVQRVKCYDSFQIDISRKMMLADYENLETPEFFDAREKAFKFLYGEGWGFATVLDRTAGIIGKVGTFIGVITIMSVLSPVVVILFIIIIVINGLLESRTKRQLIQWDMERTPLERRTAYMGDLISDYTSGKEIRLYSMREWILGKYRGYLIDMLKYYKKSAWKNLQLSIYAITADLVKNIIAYSYLISMVIRNSISIGDYTMYLGAINSFTSAMNDVTSSIVDVRRFGQYYDAVKQFMSVPQTMREGRKINLQLSDSFVIEFKNVSFIYKGQKTKALSDVSIKFTNQDHIAIVGENGSGKTTFIKLLLRLYDPTEGEILLNGVNIKDIDYEVYLSLFSAVFQDYKLFSFSIYENIALSKSDVMPEEQVKRAVALVGLTSKISELEDGLGTLINKDFDSNGVILSGGESQKVALARAVCKDSSVVVLDEPTAALDPKSEYEIYQSFHEIVDHKMAFFISHRLASTQFCNRILLFSHGSVIEDGDHRTLMDRNGEYARMFNMQAQYYK